jgi:hypothetical protein
LKRRILCATLLLAGLAGCRSSQPQGPAGPNDAETVARLLAGSFSSSEQHGADAENFFDILLNHAPIWPERDDGPWLYVEQALAQTADRPYRQRVYRVVQLGPGQVESQVYSLPGDALRYAGAWRDPVRLAGLKPGQLELRNGCSVYLQREGENFVGGTRGSGCIDTSRRAAYVSSEVTVTPGELRTLDRGFDAAGGQVWGSQAGPYVFRRMTGLVPR